MNAPDERRGRDDRRAVASSNSDALTEEELRALEVDPLPSREAMSTLLWAPAPGTIAPSLDGLGGDLA